MKIVILTAGTRGDVQPYVALAQGLQAAGHQVKVATGSNFEGFVRAQGVDFAPLRVDYLELMESPEGRDLKSGNPIRMMRQMRTVVFPLIRRLLDDLWTASQDAELIVFHPKTLGAAHVAEKLNVPCIAALALPLLRPTSAFPAPGLVNRNLGPLNRLTYAAVNAAAAPFGGIIKAWRRDTLGLPERSEVVTGITNMHGKPVPALMAYSRHVLPIPADWDDTVHVTGYWFLKGEAGWQPPADLLGFLEAGDAPVYVGFGSMVAEDSERVTRIVIEALQQAGVRGLIATGWGGLGEADLPPTIFRLKEAPHDWLFERVSAVVHHGGAGTTAAGLRAGKPTVVVPFMVDQPFWGNVVHRLGVGPQPIPQKRLTVEGLSDAIRAAVSDTAMRQRAETLGAKLRAEDGVGNAVQVIHSIVGIPHEAAQASVPA